MPHSSRRGPWASGGGVSAGYDRSMLRLTFLGTGTSMGVPMIACDCRVCTSDDPRDHRLRSSVLVQWGPGDEPEHQVLIDATPDFRTQALRAGIRRLDAVLYTHAHADHILGTDDLRRLNTVMESPIDIYAEPNTLSDLRRVFRYIFEPGQNINPSYVANLIAFPVAPGEAFELHGVTVTPLRLMHGRLPIVGYRFDREGQSIAYCTDHSTIPTQTYPLLQGVDVLVLDGLRHKHHPTHTTVGRAIEYAQELEPKACYLTHIAHDLLHAEDDAALPEGVHLAYDGLTVTAGQDAGAAGVTPAQNTHVP